MRRFTVVYSLLLVAGCMVMKPLLAASPAGLERLFTTVEQRKQLDRMRREGVGSVQRIEVGVVDSGVSHVRIDGVVVGSDGRKAVWVNGRRLPSQSVLDGMDARIRLVNNGRVAVKPAKQRRSALLKPGQVLDLGDGSIHESYDTRAGSQISATGNGHAR